MGHKFIDSTLTSTLQNTYSQRIYIVYVYVHEALVADEQSQKLRTIYDHIQHWQISVAIIIMIETSVASNSPNKIVLAIKWELRLKSCFLHEKEITSFSYRTLMLKVIELFVHVAWLQHGHNVVQIIVNTMRLLHTKHIICIPPNI